MKVERFLRWLPLLFFLAGCSPFASQTPYPPSSAGSGYPAPGGYSMGTVQPYSSGTARRDYVWQKALEGMTLGGAVAGPYGMGGGLVIGLLAGLFTANIHEAQINNQIQTEQAKDKDLEAKLDEELERQRKLEAQLGLPNGSTSPPQQTPPAESTPKPATASSRTPAQNQPPIAVASVDKKQTVASLPAPFKNVEIRDINGDGIPDVWIYYNPLKAGEIVRQEEATHGDGNVNSWSYFRDGKLVRREVDTKGRGAADTVFYYENDAIVREDRDDNGTGQMTSRVTYQNGRRAKLEEDTSGSGKMDHWIYYDPSRDGEMVVREERDLNGDGTVDVWSYYENGRLVRRDVSAAGLELLADKDQAPSMLADKPTLRPQLVTDVKR